jgi:hypothetical protein
VRSNRPVERPAEWGEGVEPTPEQWTAWFVALPPEDQHAVASRVLDNGRIAVDCFVRHGTTPHPTLQQWAENRAVLQHEAETPMRDHTDTCCAQARLQGRAEAAREIAADFAARVRLGYPS